MVLKRFKAVSSVSPATTIGEMGFAAESLVPLRVICLLDEWSF